MRACPKCSFLNPDEFPTCVRCNTNIASVPSIPVTDPEHPEYVREEVRRKRHTILRKQLFEAGVVYVIVITGAVMFAGAWLDPRVLLFSAGAAVVAYGVTRGMLGMVLAPLLQALLTIATYLFVGIASPIAFFTMGAHIFCATLFHYWVELIYDMRR